MDKKVLNLSLTKEWYEKVASGEKTEEYRHVKDYWIARLILNPSAFYLKRAVGKELDVIPYTHVRFTNGYPKGGEPYIEKEIVSITIGKPKKGLCPAEWLDKEVFIIKFK